MLDQQTVTYEINNAEVIKNLKIKCNLQLDKIEELQVNLNKKIQEAEILRQQLKKEQEQKYLLDEQLSKTIQDDNNFQSYDIKNDAMNSLNSFCRILKKIMDRNEFITYKNESKNSRRYCKVEKSVFDAYLDQEPSITEKSIFFNLCIDLSLLKSDETRKYIFNDTKDNQQLRIYFISKYIINVLSGEYRND